MLFLLSQITAKLIKVNGKKKAGWHYLGRFTFNGKESNGLIIHDILGVDKQTNLLYYSDANVDWKKVYHNRKNCKQVIQPSQITHNVQHKQGNLTVDKTPSPTYWYIAIANCEKDFEVKGTIHLLDIEYEDATKTFNSEFDWSQQSDPNITAVYVIFFGALFAQQLFNFFAKMRPKRHMFVHLVTWATFCICVGYIFKLIWCTEYSKTGRAMTCDYISLFIVMTGDLLLILIAMFIGQGYLISNPTIQYKIPTFVLFGISATAGYSMVIYHMCLPDDPLSAYSLESVPGIIYNCTRVACGIFFAVTIFTNRQKETYSERKALYTTLFIVYFAFLVGPMVWFGISFAYPKWFRETNNYLFSRMLDFIAICVIVYLTNPDSIEDNFRMHGVTGNVVKHGQAVQNEDDEEEEHGKPMQQEATIDLPSRKFNEAQW